MQQEYFGIGVLENLQGILEYERVGNLFLVRGRTSFQTSGAEDRLNPLLQKYLVGTFLTSSCEPQIEDIKKGMGIFLERRYDVVVAVGGGNSLDTAKAIALLAEQEDIPERYVKRELSLRAKQKLFIAIPTTSGSGSEATHFAVVYIEKKKYSLAHPSLLPEYAVVDPSLTFSLSPYITAYTGMDTITQAVESYWSIHATDESQGYAREAITLALKHLETAVNSPTTEARIGMSKAANLAGKAINISKTTVCHALSYPITSYFNVPHGHAAALTLSEMVAYNAEITSQECLDKRGIAYVQKALEELCVLFGVSTAPEMKLCIEHLMESIHLERSLHKLGITSQGDIEVLLQGVNAERANNNPRQVTKEKLREVLRRIL